VAVADLIVKVCRAAIHGDGGDLSVRAIQLGLGPAGAGLAVALPPGGGLMSGLDAGASAGGPRACPGLLRLLGLLLAAPSLRAMLLIVTGFTVAHSITLSAAALGLLSLPASLVEPAIAASIAYVGIENFWRPAPKRRVVITFLLGLVHGFGFAGMLAELGLPRDALALALVAFNGGVEIGQAVIVAVTLPILLWMRRFPWWEARAVPAASVGVTLAGMYWFVERVAG
jgi:hypothetical protein